MLIFLFIHIYLINYHDRNTHEMNGIFSICFFISFFSKSHFFIILVIHVIKVFIISCFFPHDNHMIQIMRLLRYAIVVKTKLREKGGFICELTGFLLQIFINNPLSKAFSTELNRMLEHVILSFYMSVFV